MTSVLFCIRRLCYNYALFSSMSAQAPTKVISIGNSLSIKSASCFKVGPIQRLEKEKVKL